MPLLNGGNTYESGVWERGRGFGEDASNPGHPLIRRLVYHPSFGEVGGNGTDASWSMGGASQREAHGAASCCYATRPVLNRLAGLPSLRRIKRNGTHSEGFRDWEADRLNP